MKERLSKIPKAVVEGQPLLDLEQLMAGKIQAQEQFQKADAACVSREAAFAEEEVARAKLLKDELQQPEEEHA